MPSKILKLGEKNEAPGPWPTNILEIGTVGTRKKPCPLCGLWFAEENLTGMSSLKTVLTLKVKWGVKGANEKLTDSRMTASRLYTGVNMCAFCAQLTMPDPEDEDDAEIFANSPQKTPKKSSKKQEVEIQASTFLQTFLSPEAKAKYK